jgi:hypothetical protein
VPPQFYGVTGHVPEWAISTNLPVTGPCTAVVSRSVTATGSGSKASATIVGGYTGVAFAAVGIAFGALMIVL